MSLIKNFQYAVTGGVRLPVQRTGNVIRCTQAQAAFNVRFDDEELIELQAGMGIQFEQSFKHMVIESATSQTITLYIGDGQIADSRFYGSINALITPGSSGSNAVDVTIATATTNAVAANLLRRAITIGAFAANTLSLRVGFNADATHGIELQPGTNWRFETTAALQVFNGTGVNQSYWLHEES